MTQSGADALRALHVPGDPVVLVNVWDAVSARVVAAQPRCRALATASWSVAAAHGHPDGEALPPDLLFAAIERIAGATDLPLSADLERGYGDVPRTAGRARDAGAVGCNLEDAMGDVDAMVAGVVAAVDAGMVVNARTDAFLFGVDGALDVAVDRGRAFLDAGAACVFTPGVTDEATIAALVGALGHVSVLATPASPPLPRLAEIGVCRVSFGPGPLGVATAALAAAAAGLLAGGAYPAELAHRPSVPDR